ncbi:apolipoprotein N-acyltransferase [Maricaulis sp. CAU 1757]
MRWGDLRTDVVRRWMARTSGWKHILVLVLAGAVSSLAMAPLHIWPALAVGLFVLLWSADSVRTSTRPMRTAFGRGFVFGFGYFLAGTFWIAFAFITRGPGFGLLVPVAVPAFAALLAVFWGLAIMLYVWIAKSSVWRVLVFAAAITLTEWIRGHLFGGLPWNLPGYTWAAGGAMSQTAAWFGVYGLTFLTVFILAAPAVAVGSRFSTARLMPAFAGLALGFILIFSGAVRLSQAEQPVWPDVRLRIVHANLTQAEKWGPDGEALTRDRYLALTGADGIDQVTHVLWPEGAMPNLMLEDGQTLGEVASLLDNGQVLVAGVNRRSAGEDGYAYFNALSVLRFRQSVPRIDALYDKVRLTPFGEMIPLSGLVSAIGFDEFARLQFTPGTSAMTLDVPGAPPMMPLICYEAIFPGFVRSVDERPQWLFNLSNDAWFGVTSGPYQHFNQTRYRSIETGLPLVRSAARGVSGLVDPFGRAVLAVSPGQEGAYDVALPAGLTPPPYWRWGDWPILALLVLILAGAVVERRGGLRGWLSTPR